MSNEGDIVLVFLARKDPAQGVVLGGLYAQNQVPDHEWFSENGSRVDRDRHFTWTTTAGQRILLDKAQDLLRLENDAGAVIELKGSSVLIKGKRVDFEQL